METVVRIVILFQVFLAVGCLAPEDGLEVGTDYQSISAFNGLAMNGLAMNGLAMNGLAMNGLTVTDVVANGLDSASAQTLASTEDGSSLLHYLVQCALPTGDAVTVSGITYNGLFGLAPLWKNQSLGGDGQHAVTSCLLAHVNHFGVSVWISGRVHGYDDTTLTERQRFNHYEGTYYGNIFSAVQTAYACMGNAPPDFSVAYPNHDTTAGDRLMRRCMDPDPANPGYTLCGMLQAGNCSDVCDTEIYGSHSNCWADASRTGSSHALTMSTWLLRHDDVDSVWSLHYDSLYGP